MRRRDFLRHRDGSTIGARVASRWAGSLKPRAEVIEIACGGGLPVTSTLVEAELRVWAIDASPTLVSVFGDRFPDVPVQCDTVLESNYFERKFDAAISIGLIFLLDQADQLKMIDRVADILRPGASFLFTAPVEIGSWTDVNTGHACRSLGQQAYESALAASGFRVADRYEDRGRNHYYEAEKTAEAVSGQTT